MPGIDRRAKRQRRSSDPLARYLGPLQAQLMNLCWERESATVRELLEDLNKPRMNKLAYTTVMTLMSRLYGRGLLVRQLEGRGFRYRPSKSRDELLAELSNDLIDQLLDDFGAIAVERLDARMAELDATRKATLKTARNA